MDLSLIIHIGVPLLCGFLHCHSHNR